MFSILTNMVIMYVDIVLLMILLFLILSACTYCVVRVRRLQQGGQVAADHSHSYRLHYQTITILLRPTKVLFPHRNEDDGKEQLRTVVAYQNPFTGDYCVRAAAPAPASPSPDSGVSDEYEPLRPAAQPRPPDREENYAHFNILEHDKLKSLEVNGVNKTWNWNYKEYQI